MDWLIPTAGWMGTAHRSLHINFLQINIKTQRRADRLYQLFPSLRIACGLTGLSPPGQGACSQGLVGAPGLAMRGYTKESSFCFYLSATNKAGKYNMVSASTALWMQWKFILRVEFTLVPKLCFVFDISPHSCRVLQWLSTHSCNKTLSILFHSISGQPGV